MDLGRSEAWARPFKCAICGRRAADKFTIEHHVQFGLPISYYNIYYYLKYLSNIVS